MNHKSLLANATLNKKLEEKQKSEGTEQKQVAKFTNEKSNFKLKIRRQRPFYEDEGDQFVMGRKGDKINKHFNFKSDGNVKMKLHKYTQDSQNSKFHLKTVSTHHKVFQNETKQIYKDEYVSKMCKLLTSKDPKYCEKRKILNVDNYENIGNEFYLTNNFNRNQAINKNCKMLKDKKFHNDVNSSESEQNEVNYISLIDSSDSDESSHDVNSKQLKHLKKLRKKYKFFNVFNQLNSAKMPRRRSKDKINCDRNFKTIEHPKKNKNYIRDFFFSSFPKINLPKLVTPKSKNFNTINHNTHSNSNKPTTRKNCLTHLVDPNHKNLKKLELRRSKILNKIFAEQKTI